MAQSAVMLKKKGYRVYGSDQKIYPPASTFLQNEGIKIFEGYRSQNLADNPNIVVIGNALSRGNPEVEEVLNRKLKYLSLPEIIKEFFIRGRKSIVVTGTHGKSTTTGIIAHIFKHSGYEPGFMLGGVLRDYNSGACVGKGDYFIVEGDEYDTAFFDKHSKFLHYLPDHVIINAIEYDHADIFVSLDDIMTSFRHLINIIPSNGALIVNGHDENAVNLSRLSLAPVLTFGLNKEFSMSGDNFLFTKEGTSFDLYKNGNFQSRVNTKMLGYHNVKNVLGALLCAINLGIEEEAAIKALNTYIGVKRRLELILDDKSIKVYDDFAHHPTSIKVTLEALRLAYPDRRIIAIFEPRSNTMVTNIFEKELPSSFDSADIILISGIHRPDNVKKENRLNPEFLCNQLNKNGKSTHYMKNHDNIPELLEELVKTDDVLVFMSNGDFGGIAGKFVKNYLQNSRVNGKLS